MPIKAPRLPYDRLREIAESFLAEYHARRSLPVPIEEIIEFQFKMDIVPVPGIRGVLEIDAWVSNDLTTIHVDEFVYYKRPNRYRFSLAHELSHRLIHADVFKQLRFKTIAEWRAAIDSIPTDQILVD